jgi:hypothetical protein
LSYPGETGVLAQIVARDAFLDSLNDPDLRIKVLERDAVSIEQAYSIVARLEAFSERADANQEDTTRKRVRAVNAAAASTATDSALEAKLDQLEQGMRQLQGAMQSLIQQQQLVSTAQWMAGSPMTQNTRVSTPRVNCSADTRSAAS